MNTKFLDYAQYYLAPLIQLLSCYGLYLGGHYVWIGLASFPLLALFDSLLPRDMRIRQIRSRGWAYVPIWISTLLGPVIYVMLAWSLLNNQLTWVQMLGAGLSTAWLSVLPLIPAAHELYHARGALGKWVGRYVQVCYLDPTRMEAHVVGHHIDVATVEDTDTAARGQTLYSFAPSAVVRSFIQSQQFECQALVRRGHARWSIRHRLWRGILAQVLFLAMLYAVGGLLALGVSLGAMVLARFWIETFNYFQHYGQVRVLGTPIEKRHVWNHFGPLSRIVAFEITNHADHHLNSYAPYYALEPHKDSVPMPSVFVCFLSALVPSVWFRFVIKPALKEWDLRYASGDEQQLARRQNEQAGWENWLPGSPSSATRAEYA